VTIYAAPGISSVCCFFYLPSAPVYGMLNEKEVIDLQQIIMETSALRLPPEFADKIGSSQVMIREISEGLLLTPVPNYSDNLRGILKDTNFSTERYFEQKQLDKELEK
jgi:hypothetical protein